MKAVLIAAAALLAIQGIAFSSETAQEPYSPDASTIALYHFERILAAGKIYDSGPLGLHAEATPSVQIAEGKFRNALQFNGVDSAVFLPKKVSLSAIVGTSIEMWICPDNSPEEPLKGTFEKVFKEAERRFTWNKISYVARLGEGAETGADWGVASDRGSRGRVRGKEGSNMFIVCSDSPFSSACQQLFLRRGDGRLQWQATGGYGPKGKMEHGSMTSKSVVWKKGQWTRIRIDLAPYPGEFSMYVNGQIEAKIPLQALPPSHTFILGGSLQDGVPFAGKIDEFRVESLVAPELLLFPYGNMKSLFYEYDTGLSLPKGFLPFNLEPSKDRTRAQADPVQAGKTALALNLSGANRGMIAVITSFQRGPRNLNANLKGDQGTVTVKTGPTMDEKSAKEVASASFDGNWKKIECPLDEGYAFFIFSQPGEYLVEDCMVEAVRMTP